MVKIKIDKRKDILAHFAIQLKSIGFKKVGHSLIHESEKGLIQVLDFTLGQNTSITRNHLGLGFGIFTDEWFAHLNFGKKPKNFNESHCELRSEFNEFVPKDNNFCWIDLDLNINSIIEKSGLIIGSFFLPQLNQLTTRNRIIEQWNQKGNAIGLPPRGRLSIAIIYWYLNQKSLAKNLIDIELINNKGNPYFKFVIDKYEELKKNAP